MARDRDYDAGDDYNDEYDDNPRPRRRSGGGSGPLDNMFANTNIVVLILFAVCCNGIAFILGLIGVLTAKDPQAKTNAMITMAIGAVITVIGVIVQIAGIAAGGAR